MPDTADLTSQMTILIAGDEVQREMLQQIIEVTVDQHAHLPGTFTIRLHDPNLNLLDNGPFDLTKEIEIKAEKSDGSRVSLIKGEVTALEPGFGEGMIAELIVRGYDKSHRLLREMVSKSYLNKKDSDLAQEIAQAAGLNPKVNSTQTVYEHIYQHNQTNLEFLTYRAWRIGFECFVADGKLYFRKPSGGGAGPKVKWGEDLLSFHPRINLAEQVDEVVVRGWDPEKKEVIVGKATNGRLYPKVQDHKNGADWAKTFGKGRVLIVDLPVTTQAEANALAAARLDEISGAFVEGDGVVFRRPDITAGQMVTIEGLGKRFSGSYLVTRSVHEFTSQGLHTIFSVGGTRTGLLAETLAEPPVRERWPGVVVGLVTNTDDPKKWGRVKLKFPTLSDNAESSWARVLGLGAADQTGLFILPQVGDEVLVIFENGEFNRPYVLGGLWNGKSSLPPEVSNAAKGDLPLVRTWHSPNGHWIAMYDDQHKKIEIVSADGRSITIDDSSKEIVLKTRGVTITLEDQKLSVESQSDISIKASANLKLEANGNIDIKASGQVNVNGAVINLN